MTIYSGDLTNLLMAKKHKLISVVEFNGFTVVKFCPPVTSYSVVSLAANETFDYLTNTTGKMVYYDNAAKVIKFIEISHSAHRKKTNA
jgi:hypothetical protein